jgi:beta-lactamase class D
VLRGKTGTRGENEKLTLGWFVGWVEREGKTLVFAANIAAADKAWGPTARDITRAILRKIGWGPPDGETRANP